MSKSQSLHRVNWAESKRREV